MSRTESKKRKVRLLAQANKKTGQQQTETGQPEQKLNEAGNAKQTQPETKPKFMVENIMDQKGQGEISRSDMRDQLRSLTWQKKNRFPTENATADGKDIPEKTVEVIHRGLDHKSIRVQLKAAETAIRVCKVVQSDDHAKLRADLRPTPINQNINIDQRQDNRRVMLIIPSNGRDDDSRDIASSNYSEHKKLSTPLNGDT